MKLKRYIAQLIVLMVLIILARSINAQESTPSPTPTPAIVKYELAYPGILPDNFLYKIKVFRDKMQLIMTSDSQKRIELLLKMADKGILASAMLVDKKEWNLAKETALKAENNMTLLTPQLGNLNDQVDPALIKRLQTASLKHQEVLTSLLERTPKDTQVVFSQVIDFSKRNLEQINAYAITETQ
jgi:hypothetical protein